MIKETYYDLAIESDQDPQRAFDYFKRAAELGHPAAQYEPAKIYDGRKSPTNIADYRLAQQYYEYAVDNGYVEAEVPLAEILVDPFNPDCFDRGLRELAAKLFDKHVLKNSLAAFKLGLMYKNGIPMSKQHADLVLATHYLQIAATQDHKDAQKELDNLRSKKLNN